MDQPIRLLHLSDIHFRAGKAWDADPVLRALARFIAGEVRSGLVPDLVVITGDLAFAATAADYRLARDWLADELWQALTIDPSARLAKDRLLLVPGNHDVDRDRVDFIVQSTQSALLKGADQDQVAKVLAAPAQRKFLLKRHGAYLKFCADWFGTPQPFPWWQRSITIRGQRLHVAGLDSAWMACGDTDRGHLLLGRYQINQTVLHADGRNAHWHLALLHHPWDYLAEFDLHEARPDLHLHLDLLLRGHLHAGEAAFIRPADPARACLELAAGCVYDGSRHPNAFQWIELWPAPRRVQVLFRAWIKGAWQVDRNQPGCPDGQADFLLDPEAAPGQAKPGAAAQPPAIPAAYLDWLRCRYESVELLGLEAQAQHPTQLSQVYVPAITPARRVEAVPDAAAPDGRPDDGPPHELLLSRLGEGSLYCPGDPGAGKSTFCRWLALVVAGGAVPAHPIGEPDDYPETFPAALRDRLPVLVPLRDFWPALPLTPGGHHLSPAALSAALGGWLAEWAGGRLEAATFTALLGTGRCLLILDGIDEVPVVHGDGARRTCPRACLLAALAHGLGDWTRAGNRLLLTSRPYGLRPDALRRLALPEAPLAALDEEIQSLFIRRWYAAADPSQGEDKARGLIDHLVDRPDLQELKRNPMLLTALCVRYGEGRRLPQDLHDLYDKLVNNVLFNRYRDADNERRQFRGQFTYLHAGYRYRIE